MSDDTFHRQQVEIANIEYEEEKSKDNSHRVTIRMIERRNKLRPGQLVNYRANVISRNHFARE